MADLGVIILTHNEEKHIGRAIEAVRGVARAVVVVDSYSTDRTVEIARAAGATVLQNRWINYAAQFQWGIENAGLDTAWLMRLDADEIVEPDLAKEIEARLPQLPADVTGVVLNRKHIFMGRFVRHGGRFPLYLLRIWRKGAAHIEQRWMDEHMVLTHGRSVTFAGGFADVNLNDLTFFTDKHNKYATREAIDVLDQKFQLFHRERADINRSSSLQAKAKRFLKENLYNKIGVSLAPTMYFLYRYIIQMGFLDGKEGFMYHFLQGYWYRFLVASKVVEFERAVAHLKDKDEIVRELARLTGLNLNAAPGT